MPRTGSPAGRATDIHSEGAGVSSSRAASAAACDVARACPRQRSTVVPDVPVRLSDTRWRVLGPDELSSETTNDVDAIRCGLGDDAAAVSARSGTPVSKRRAPLVAGREFAADVSSVDRLAEHSRFPERERLEPRQGRFGLAATALGVARDQFAPCRKAVQAVTGDVPSGFSRRRARCRSRRDSPHRHEGRRSCPSPSRGRPLSARLPVRHDHVPQAVVAVDDGRHAVGRAHSRRASGRPRPRPAARASG